MTPFRLSRFPLCAAAIVIISVLTASPHAFAAQAIDGYTYTTVLAFDPQTTGYNPVSLIIGEDGNLYGTTASRSVGDNTGLIGGTLYRFSPTTNTYSTLMYFNTPGVPGRAGGGIVFDKNGDIYGVTDRGGSDPNNFDGGLFRYSISTNTYTTLVDFSAPGILGKNPVGDLTIGSDGSIYGATRHGGSNTLEKENAGTLFRYTPLTDTFTTLVDFSVRNDLGANPVGSLIVGTDGSLFGTTSEGGTNAAGTLFHYNASTGDVSTLVNFGTPGLNNRRAASGLTEDAAGVLYGTTYGGGIFDDGTLYSYNPATGDYNTLVQFRTPTAPGDVPRGDLVLGKYGDIYGTTQFGVGPGTSPGTLYRYEPSTQTYSTVVQFGPMEDSPLGNLQLADDGSLYGLTSGGNGTLFRLTVLVPEASTIALVLPALGIAGAVGIRRRKKRS